jgi:TIR domain
LGSTSGHSVDNALKHLDASVVPELLHQVRVWCDDDRYRFFLERVLLQQDVPDFVRRLLWLRGLTKDPVTKPSILAGQLVETAVKQVLAENQYRVISSSVPVWDVFISHASEDKFDVAKPLADTLTRMGLRVWYDEFALQLGDRLRQSIDRGLALSRFGIVILSESFFAKNWTQAELDGLTAKEADGIKVILPVWHGLTRADVAKRSPMLADRIAANTSQGINFVAQQVLSVVQQSKAD